MPIKIETPPKGWFGNWTDDERKFWDRGEDDPQALLAVRHKDVVVTVDVELYEDKDGLYQVYLCSVFRNEEAEERCDLPFRKQTFRCDLAGTMLRWLYDHVRRLEFDGMTEKDGEPKAMRKLQAEALMPGATEDLTPYVDPLGYKGSQRLKVAHERDFTGDVCAFCGAMQFLGEDGKPVCGNIHD